MNLPPKDYTDQEYKIAECLSDLGLRYEQQADFFPYILDFYIPELKMVIEADGVYGHLKKRDEIRDIALLVYQEIESVIRIREST